MRLAVCGYGPMACGVLQGLLAAKANVVAVLPWSLQRQPTLWQALTAPFQSEPPLAHLARMHAIPCLEGYEGLNDARLQQRLFTEWGVDTVLVASWGEKLSKKLLKTYPNVRFLNVHPSLLPAHRGPNPYTSVLLSEGLHQTGVSIHSITPTYDAGPLWLQVAVGLNGSETGGSLRESLAQRVVGLMPQLLALLNDPSFKPSPQNEALASYYPQPSLETATLDFSKPPEYLLRQSRALQPWLATYAQWGETWVQVQQLRLVPAQPSKTALNSAERGPVKPGQALGLEAKVRGLRVASRDPEQDLVLQEVKVGNPWLLGPAWLPWGLSQALLKAQLL